MAVTSPAPERLHLSRTTEDRLILAVAVAAALVAATAGAAPTGTMYWDELLKAALGGGVVLAGAKSPRWAVLVMASIGAAASSFEIWALASWGALVLSIGSTLLNRRSRLIGALAAGLAVQAVLRLPAFGFFGLQSLIAFVAITPVVVLGYRYSRTRTRKTIRRALVLIALGTIAILLLGGVSLLNARSDVDRGVSAARRGLQAARSGDTQAIVDELALAERALEAGEDRLSSLSSRALRLIPIASQHQRAIETATAEGALLGREASTVVQEADVSAISLQAGSVDLTALQAMAPQLRATADLLQGSLDQLDRDDSPWLLPVVSGRIDELAAEIASLLPEVELGAEAAATVPDMLGASGSKTYLVFFGTPAESREFGGFVGSWAVITFDQGRLRLGESGRIQELYATARESQITPGTVSPWFIEMARPTQFPQNLTSSPDLSQVADVSRQVLGAGIEQPLDGLVYLDAYAIGDLLELTGPVQNPVTGQTLSADNAAAFFFDEQYRIAQDRTEVFDSFAGVAATVLARINQQTLPGPERLGQVMGPAARAGRLQVVTFDDRQNDFLRSIHLLRDFGQQSTQDFVGVVQTNGLANKLDLYLQRTLQYNAVVTDGAIAATATVTLRSEIPANAPESVFGSDAIAGVNKVRLSLYSPHRLVAVTVDGAQVDLRSAVEFDLGRYLIEVDVLPTGDEVVVEYALEGQLAAETSYSLEIWHQPLVNSDQVDVSIIDGKDMISWRGELVENVVLSTNS